MNFRRTVLLLAVIPLLALPMVARADDDPATQFRAELRGRNEVPLTLSGGHGSLRLTVNDDDTSVHFVLRFSGLQTTVAQSHIHVGQANVNGGVTVFFCGGPRPACPQQGTVEGDFTAADVITLPSQQLEADNLAKLLKAIRAGQTYANVHTMTSPGGEIRGQILAAERDR